MPIEAKNSTPSKGKTEQQFLQIEIGSIETHDGQYRKSIENQVNMHLIIDDCLVDLVQLGDSKYRMTY